MTPGALLFKRWLLSPTPIPNKGNHGRLPCTAVRLDLVALSETRNPVGGQNVASSWPSESVTTV